MCLVHGSYPRYKAVDGLQSNSFRGSGVGGAGKGCGLHAANVRICGHHSTKRTMPMFAYADLDFENWRCLSDVSDTKLTNTDDSLGIPCLLFIGLRRVCSMTHWLADYKKVYR